MNWNARKQKQATTYPIIYPRAYESILTLSGETCTDLQYGLKNNCIDKNTRIHIIERDRDVVQRIGQQIKRLRLRNVEIFSGELHTFPCTDSYDLVNIDLLGNVRHQDLNWMRKRLIKCLLPDGNLCLTSYTAIRANSFVPTMYSLLSEELPGVMEELTIHFRSWVQATLHLLVKEYVLEGYTCTDEFITPYHDKSDMVLFAFHGLSATRKQTETQRKLCGAVKRALHLFE